MSSRLASTSKYRTRYFVAVQLDTLLFNDAQTANGLSDEFREETQTAKAAHEKIVSRLFASA